MSISIVHNRATVQAPSLNVLETALLSVIVSLPLWPSYLFVKFEGFPGINVTRVLIFGLIMLWAFAILINHSYRYRFNNFLLRYRKLLLFVLLPLFGWKLLTTTSATDRTAANFSAIKDIIYFLFLFLMSVNIWRFYNQTERVVKTLVIASLIVFTVTALEVLIQQNLFASLVPASFVSSEKIIHGLIRDGKYRAWGTFPHPLALANYCTTVYPMVIWYAVSNPRRRSFGFLVCIALLFTIYLSTSRAGLVVLAFMACGFLISRYLPGWIQSEGKRTVSKVVLSFFISLILLFGILFFTQQLTSGRTEKEAGSTSVRLLQMELGLPLIKSHPIIGYGPGEAEEVLGLSAKTVDNYYLTLALESGLPEVCLFILTLLYFLRMAWKLQKKLPNPASGLATAIFWSICGNAIFLTVLSIEQALPIVFLQFGMLVSLNSISTGPEGRSLSRCT